MEFGLPQDLLNAAFAHAERADRSVQAAIWLRAARVMTKFDAPQARQLIERGVSAARTLEPPDREPLMHTAVSMAATVTPALAVSIADRDLEGPMREGALSQAFFHMADHGLIDEAAAILSSFPEHLPFPFDGVTNVLGRTKDETMRRRILEGAVRAYRGRQRAQDARSGMDRRAFITLFNFHWQTLLPEMALDTVRDLLDDALEEPDGPIHASVNQIRFSSSRQHRLFEILGPLRRLDSPSVEPLLAAYPQLAKAAASMPFGMYSSATTDSGPSSRPTEPRETIDALDLDSMQIGHRLMSMREAVATKFTAAFDIADRKFEADANGGNLAPKEAWPSTGEYRAILYKAGRHQGRVAAEYLERIPDVDVRMLAAIELAAVLAGLPQVGGVMIGSGGRRRRPTGPPGPLPPHIRELLERHRRGPLSLPARPNLAPSQDVRISVSSRPAGSRMGGGAGSDFWVMEGVPLKAVLAKIYDMPERRIEIPPRLERDRFDFTLVFAQDESHEIMQERMREGILRHFQINVSREAREQDVYLVTADAGVKLKPTLHSNFGGSSIGYTSFGGTNLQYEHERADLRQIMDLHMAGEVFGRDGPENGAREMGRMMAPDAPGSTLTSLHGDLTIGAVCEALEGCLDRLVVDETGLTGSYEFHVEIDAQSATTLAFLEALRDATGIVVAPARRNVPMLIVRATLPKG